MVAVSDKQETRREARASGRVIMQQTTLAQIVSGALPKGDVLQVARIAGISAVKRTADLIPLCHPLRITGVKLHFVPQPEKPDLCHRYRNGSPRSRDGSADCRRCRRSYDL